MKYSITHPLLSQKTNIPAPPPPWRAEKCVFNIRHPTQTQAWYIFRPGMHAKPTCTFLITDFLWREVLFDNNNQISLPPTNGLWQQKKGLLIGSNERLKENMRGRVSHKSQCSRGRRVDNNPPHPRGSKKGVLVQGFRLPTLQGFRLRTSGCMYVTGGRVNTCDHSLFIYCCYRRTLSVRPLRVETEIKSDEYCTTTTTTTATTQQQHTTAKIKSSPGKR